MEEEERKEITRAIEEADSVQKQEGVINKGITTAFEKGRISEAEYYYLLVQYHIIFRLDDLKIVVKSF